MADLGDGERRRILLPQALGADEFLRVTWHERHQVMVFSHWSGNRCVAATPVRVSDVGELAELTVTALARAIDDRVDPDPSSQDQDPGDRSRRWGPPLARELVDAHPPSTATAG